MPAAVRRTTTSILLALACALALAGAALAGSGNGGVTPQNAGTPGAEGIHDSYVLIGGVTLGIFVLVEGLLIAFVIRFRRRNRARTEDGPQIHGSTRLELMWTVGPVVLLVAIATFVFWKLPQIQDVPPASAAGGRIDITVEGHQFYWLFRYPNGAVSVNRMVAPVGRNVRLTVVSPPEDVIHSWWVPALGGKIDAIPGRVNHTWFRAPHTGTYRGQCAELCGLEHASMKSEVDVVPVEQYERYVAQQRRLLDAASPRLGRELFEGVCQTCHRIEGPTLVGPTLGGNPLLADRNGLADVVRNGRGQMPAVGAGWSDQEVDALVAYTKTLTGGGATGG